MTSDSGLLVDIVIPARNEETNLKELIAAIPIRTARAVVVVDNGSTDGTAAVAEDAGAIVVREARVGFGAACLRGVTHLSTLPQPPGAVVFLPADGSYNPAEIPNLLLPLRENLFDLVIGSRTLGSAMRPRLKAKNLVPLSLIHAIYGHRYTDLSPFRAIRYPALVALGLKDSGYGWLAEMQVKAIRFGLRISEVPVEFRPPRGRSRMKDRVRETAGMTGRTLYQIFRHATAR